MSFGLTAAIVGGVGAVAGAVSSASASSKAAKAQTNAAAQSAKAQKEAFDKQVQLQEPFRNAGLAAQNQLLTLLGIQPQTAAPPPPQQYDELGRPIDAQGRVIKGGAVQGQPDPSIPQYNYAVNPNDPQFGSMAKSFGMDQFNADPGYAFRMSEGMKAIERSAAAKGGLLSGTTLKGITRFGQDTASNEYQNAFNRYQVERQARLNPLQSLMGAGQTSAGTLTQASGQLGQGLGQAAVAQGAAKASSYMNQSTALNNAIGSVGQNFMMYNMMNPGGGGQPAGTFGMGGQYGYMS
jgi:hypothetical protein